MSLEYIRQAYEVPARRGGRLRYTNGQGVVLNCTIKSAKGSHLMVEVDDKASGQRNRMKLHPTWQVEYVKEAVGGT